MSKIGAAIPICEQDKDYLPVIFSELDRLDVDVSWLANNCSPETIKNLLSFERTKGIREY